MSAPHVMELPRRIVIGDGNIGQIGNFLVHLVDGGHVSLVSGIHVKRILGSMIEASLKASGMTYHWHIFESNDVESFSMAKNNIVQDEPAVIVGMGGGRSVDIAKMTATSLHKPYVSIPTAASHDGMASPFVSVKGDRPHSSVATSPLGVFVDLDIIRRAPPRLLASGCGDLVANIIAVRDWQLGHERTGEYYGRYSASLAMMSANIIMENAAIFAERGPDVRLIVEALISAGVASCIAGSSRPCSGAEHLFSHALDRISPGRGLHGEKCGMGSIIMAKLHGLDWQGMAAALKSVGAPITAADIGITDGDVVRALCVAQSLRPNRYTILKDISLNEDSARRLAMQTGVI